MAMTAVLGALVGAAAPAGAQARPATILRCEADFAGFMIGTGTETIDATCADLGPAYQAGIAAYQVRNAECGAIRALSNPIRRAECEARAKWEGERAFRTTAEALRAVAAPTPAAPTTPTPTTAAPAPTATVPLPAVAPPAPAPVDDGQSVLTDGVNAVGRSIQNNPEAALAIGAGAATLAFPATRAATFAAGRSIPTFFTKLLDAVKTPFAAVATAIR